MDATQPKRDESHRQQRPAWLVTDFLLLLPTLFWALAASIADYLPEWGRRRRRLTQL